MVGKIFVEQEKSSVNKFTKLVKRYLKPMIIHPIIHRQVLCGKCLNPSCFSDQCVNGELTLFSWT